MRHVDVDHHQESDQVCSCGCTPERFGVIGVFESEAVHDRVTKIPEPFPANRLTDGGWRVHVRRVCRYSWATSQPVQICALAMFRGSPSTAQRPKSPWLPPSASTGSPRQPCGRQRHRFSRPPCGRGHVNILEFRHVGHCVTNSALVVPRCNPQ